MSDPTVIPVRISTLDDGVVRRLATPEGEERVAPLPREELSARKGPTGRFERFDGDHWIRALEDAVLILGPAVDPMRCRALPSEREWVALRMKKGSTVRVRPGVWVGGPFEGKVERRRASEPDFRDAVAIENRVYEPRDGIAPPPMAEMPDVLRRLRERGS